MARHVLRGKPQPIPKQFRPTQAGQHRAEPGGCFSASLAAFLAPGIALLLTIFRK
jgi:hypothetical protein